MNFHIAYEMVKNRSINWFKFCWRPRFNGIIGPGFPISEKRGLQASFMENSFDSTFYDVPRDLKIAADKNFTRPRLAPRSLDVFFFSNSKLFRRYFFSNWKYIPKLATSKPPSVCIEMTNKISDRTNFIIPIQRMYLTSWKTKRFNFIYFCFVFP